MKKQVLFSLALIVSSILFGQPEKSCGLYVPDEYKIQDSIDQIEFQDFYEDFLQSWSPNDRSLYIIPVVVHVVHLGGSENISDEQVYSAITQLNEDFSATNPELGSVIPAFTSIIGNADIEFRLATIDPFGNCHKGITRTFSQTTYDDGSGDIIDAVEDEHGTWPQNKYMNVFVCIDPNGNGGYTNYPANWYPQNSMEGSIFVRHPQFGTIGTSNVSSGTTLAHEVGHWLNLRHVWGNSNTPGLAGNCSEDDLVADTPNSIGWTGCFSSGESCGGPNNVQNYMEYSGCRYMFSQGQAARMQSALNSGTAGRNNLWTSTNLIATGTDGPGELCEASFSSNQKVICVGSSVQFYDESFHNITNRTWTFNGGSPNSSTLEDPIITFNSPGVYDVTLEVTDGTSVITTYETAYIIVLADPAGLGIPYHESFETLSSFPDNQSFMIENFDDGAAWNKISNLGGVGSYCLQLENHLVENGSIDNVISGTIDLGNVNASETLVFKFLYTYKKRFSSNNEKLKFYVSKDCGETWVLRKSISGNNLGDVSQLGAFWPVSGSNEWHEEFVTNINSDFFVSNFRYKFEFTNDSGNNIYLDEINMYTESMINTINADNPSGLSVYPNPASEIIYVEVNGQNGEEYVIELYTAIGQKVKTIFSGELPLSGKNIFDYNSSNLPKGVYILRVESKDKTETIKLIKE